MTALEKRLQSDLREAERTYEQHVNNKHRRWLWAVKWERMFGERPASFEGVRRK